MPMTNTGENDIYVIDPTTQDRIATISVGPKPQQIASAYKGIAGPNAYVTVGDLNKVIVVSGDPKNSRIAEEITVGQRPNGIWANPERSLACSSCMKPQMTSMSSIRAPVQ